MIQYQIEVQIENPGRLIVEAGWSGSRVLALRLDRGNSGAVPARRSGPSPLRLDAEITPLEAASGKPWLLSIHGLPMRQGGAGRLRITLPEPEEEVAPASSPSPPPEPSAPPPAPWRLPVPAPSGAAGPALRFHEAVERFRIEVVERHPAEPDDYQWQDPMLRFLVERRDALGGVTAPLSPETCSWLRRVFSITRSIAELRHSDDSLLSGPPPVEPGRLRAWLIVHRQRVMPMERDLDALLSEFERGHVPEFTGHDWVPRFLSCLTVCQRHFEERARLGADRAAHTDVVQRHWDALVAGSAALTELAARDQPETGAQPEEPRPAD